MPEGMNPATWMLNVIGAGTGGPSSDVDYADVYKNSALIRRNEPEITEASTAKPAATLPSFDDKYARSIVQQYMRVQLRLLQSYYRNVDFTVTRLILMVFLGILFGLVWLNIAKSFDYAGVTSSLSAIFMIGIFGTLLHSLASMPVLFRSRAVFYREQSSLMYHPMVYAVSLFGIEAIFLFFCMLVLNLSAYFMLGFDHDASNFFKYVLAHYLLGLCFVAMGRSLANSFPNNVSAEAAQGLFFSFVVLFGGVFIRGELSHISVL